MNLHNNFEFDAEWIDPVVPPRYQVVKPVTESVASEISLGSGADVDSAGHIYKRIRPHDALLAIAG